MNNILHLKLYIMYINLQKNSEVHKDTISNILIFEIKVLKYDRKKRFNEWW